MDSRYIRPDDRDWCYQSLIQECAEVTKAVTKVQMFGLAPTRDIDGQSYDNREALLSELHDLDAAIERVRRWVDAEYPRAHTRPPWRR